MSEVTVTTIDIPGIRPIEETEPGAEDTRCAVCGQRAAGALCGRCADDQNRRPEL